MKKKKKQKIEPKTSKELPLCACGCNFPVSKEGNRYRLGHNRKRNKQSENTAGMFKPGQSGNPAGKPLGVRNRVTVASENLLHNEEQALTRRLIDSAHAGNFPALKLCIERLVPVKKDVPISITLPKCKSVSDAGKLTSSILDNISDGKITLMQGQLLSKVISKHVQVLQLTDLESRLVLLEESLSSK